MITEDDLTDLDFGPLFVGSLVARSGTPTLVVVGGEDIILVDERRRVRTQLPTVAHSAAATDDTIVVATRAGFLAAWLP